MRDPILRVASHDLSHAETTIVAATPGAIPGIGGNSHESFSFAPAFSERFFQELGRSPRQKFKSACNLPAPYPKNLFGLFLTFRVISILLGYFGWPSENTL